MRRLLIVMSIIMLTVALAFNLHAADAQGTQDVQIYRSDVLGFSFQYPASWTIREQLATQTVTAASKADTEAVADAKAPAGLLFSITISTFRQIGAEQVDDFAAILKKIARAVDANPRPIRIGGAEGLVIDVVDAVQDVATRTAILSIGRRRVAVIRGVSTVSSWTVGGSEGRFSDLVASLSFFPPPGLPAADSFGKVLWQLPGDKVSDLVDISAGGDGSTLYVTARAQGIWRVSANGTSQGVVKPDGIGEFGGIGVLRDGTQYIADPAHNALWVVLPDGSAASRLLGGQVGVGRGMFGSGSPRSFAFGLKGLFYILDENENGLRIQLFSRAGELVGLWDLPDVQPGAIEKPMISTDSDGNAYVIGRNSPGIIKISAAGKVVSTDLGKAALANTGPLAMIADRYGSFFVATTDQGILNLDNTGKLIGMIGEGYDEAGPPKPGQLGKPVAMALADGGRLLYVVDAGKYPQIVAFAINGNPGLNIAAGTRDAGSISTGATVMGQITEKTFIDAYTFTGAAGDVITITMRAGAGSQVDPYLELLGPKGARLAASDDAKASDLGPLDAQIKAYRLPFDATFIIRATRFGAETTTATGTYSLTLTLDQTGKKTK
jgi:hypothetical protein